METENFVAFDLHAEYYRTLKASRIAATVLIFLCGLWSGEVCYNIQRAAEVFENMVPGGLSAMPSLTQFVIRHPSELLGLSSRPAFAAVLYIWIAGNRQSRVLYASMCGVAGPLLIGLVVQRELNAPLWKVITDFNF